MPPKPPPLPGLFQDATVLYVLLAFFYTCAMLALSIVVQRYLSRKALSEHATTLAITTFALILPIWLWVFGLFGQ